MSFCNKFIIILCIIGIILPNFSFGQEQVPLKAPGTLEEAKEWLKRAFEVLKIELPKTIKKIWEENVLPVWKKMWNWAKTNIWENNLKPWFQGVWEGILKIFGKELEKRKPIIEEEFEKEKEEVKTEVPKVGKSLLEKFKDLLK